MLSVGHFSSSDEEDDRSVREVRIFRRKLRVQSNIFQLPSCMWVWCALMQEKKLSFPRFIGNFRLNKDAFRYVLRTISPRLGNACRSTRIAKTLRLAGTMRILAEGSYQRGAGNDFNVGLAQSTMSNVFIECVDAMFAELCAKWISFQMTDDEKSEIKEYFYDKTGFPGVIGCVDGTHVKILAPILTERFKYCNRKGFYSLNAMVVSKNQTRYWMFA